MTFVAIDTETTGLSREDRVISLGIATRGYWGRWHFSLDAGEITPSAQEIHGITPSDLAGCPSTRASWPQWMLWIHQRHIVGHNVAFDLRMIRQTLVADGYDVDHVDEVSRPAKVTCTLAAFRRWREDGPHTLDNLCRELGVRRGRQHDALADAVATYRCAVAMQERGVLEVRQTEMTT